MGDAPVDRAQRAPSAYNTESAGYAPIGAPGPYNSLNVGALTVNPTVGTDVDEDMAFVADALATGTFVSELGWTGNRPMARIETQVPPTVPNAPTNVTAVPGEGQVTLSWTAPADGGSPITGYVIGGGGTCTPTPATATSCVVTGLTNGVPVSFTVSAVNSLGTGPAASSLTVTPLAPTTTTSTTTTVTPTTAPTTTLMPDGELPATGASTWPLAVVVLAGATGTGLVLVARRRRT